MGKGAIVSLELDRRAGEPLFLALARAITSEIERGRLLPGAALPGTRALSKNLGLNRNTVDAAYQDLILQGWLTAEPARGTSVALDLPGPERAAGRARPAPRRVPPQAPAAAQAGLLLSDGFPDARLAPRAELARAFRRALMAPGSTPDGGADDARGSFPLRRALAVWLQEERGLVATADDVLVTRGSQMALFLAAASLAAPGGVIAVENPGYPLAWGAFQAAGMRVAGVSVDEGGLVVEALEQLALREPGLRGVCVTPHHQYPTTVTMGAGRRLRLLETARRLGLTIIEDDYDHEYRFEGRPVLPLAARGDTGDSIIHVGSLSKLLTPGIRIGYAVAGAGQLAHMATLRQSIDRQGDIPLENALAELVADGTLRRHARKARRIYQARRDHFAALLRDQLADAVDFDLPPGGLALWLRIAGAAQASAWAARCQALGLTIMTGADFTLPQTPTPQAFRIGYAGLDDAELAMLVSLLRQAHPHADA